MILNEPDHTCKIPEKPINLTIDEWKDVILPKLNCSLKNETEKLEKLF
jgi:hypothetical protein